MSPLDRAEAAGDTLALLFGGEVEMVAESDRVAADLQIVKGGWRVMLDGRYVAHVSATGGIRILVDAKDLIARRAA